MSFPDAEEPKALSSASMDSLALMFGLKSLTTLIISKGQASQAFHNLSSLFQDTRSWKSLASPAPINAPWLLTGVGTIPELPTIHKSCCCLNDFSHGTNDRLRGSKRKTVGWKRHKQCLKVTHGLHPTKVYSVLHEKQLAQAPYQQWSSI